MYHQNIHYRNDHNSTDHNICCTYLFDICIQLVVIATYSTLILFEISKLLVGIIYLLLYLLYFTLLSIKVIYIDLDEKTERRTTPELEEGEVLTVKQNKSEGKLDDKVIINECNEYNKSGKSDNEFMMDDNHGYNKVKQYSKLCMIKDKIDLFIKQQSIRYKEY